MFIGLTIVVMPFTHLDIVRWGDKIWFQQCLFWISAINATAIIWENIAVIFSMTL